MRVLLTFLYGEADALALLPRLEAAIDRTRHRLATATVRQSLDAALTQEDALLIAYGDSVRSAGDSPLRGLARFLDENMAGLLSGVHILPFYPSTSDDGFSVADYRAVDPALGGWQDVEALADKHKVMFDAVINHISRASEWFQGYLRGEAPYTDYFISADAEWDLREVVRPRTLPLLTPVESALGPRLVWTTFSDDQIDLNFANPQLLFEIADLLLFYAERGASLVRLDAIAYLWKEVGTRSIHLPQTHAVVKLLRAVLDAAAPHVLLITETNVPHGDNISYFGAPLPDGTRSDEAQLVYQFPLPPLILHTLATGDSTALSRWAAQLEPPLGAFFNFTASHDGIGVLPALGLLTPEEVEQLAQRTLAHGGLISYRALSDGTQTAYELNTTWYDALNDPAQPNDDTDIARFLASQAIMLSLAGLPGIYMQSLVGARNCRPCYEETGRARSLNREKFDLDALATELAQPESRTARVFAGYRRLLAARRSHAAFHPTAPQQLLEVGSHLVALARRPVEAAEDAPPTLLCVIEVAGAPAMATLPVGADAATHWRDLLSDGEAVAGDGRLHVALEPYQVRWLVAQQ
jgi:sucrose phosphorylase